jgi:hypothetical protein
MGITLKMKNGQDMQHAWMRCGMRIFWPEKLKRSIEQERQPCQDNIKVDFKELGSEAEDWIELDHESAQLRLLSVMNLQIT